MQQHACLTWNKPAKCLASRSERVLNYLLLRSLAVFKRWLNLRGPVDPETLLHDTYSSCFASLLDENEWQCSIVGYTKTYLAVDRFGPSGPDSVTLRKTGSLRLFCFFLRFAGGRKNDSWHKGDGNEKTDNCRPVLYVGGWSRRGGGGHDHRDLVFPSGADVHHLICRHVRIHVPDGGAAADQR